MLGGFLLRINGYLVGYETGSGYHYFPSVPELLVTIGLVAFEILAYIVVRAHAAGAAEARHTLRT